VPVMARNGRETCISRLAPYVAARNDGEGMLLALILAHQHGTGLEAPWAIHSRLVASGEGVKELCSLCIKSTNGLLLDVPANEPRCEVFGEGQRGGRPERRPPQGAKLVEASDRTRSISASIASRSDDRR